MSKIGIKSYKWCLQIQKWGVNLFTNLKEDIYTSFIRENGALSKLDLFWAFKYNFLPIWGPETGAIYALMGSERHRERCPSATPDTTDQNNWATIKSLSNWTNIHPSLWNKLFWLAIKMRWQYHRVEVEFDNDLFGFNLFKFNKGAERNLKLQNFFIILYFIFARGFRHVF